MIAVENSDRLRETFDDRLGQIIDVSLESTRVDTEGLPLQPVGPVDLL